MRGMRYEQRETWRPPRYVALPVLPRRRSDEDRRLARSVALSYAAARSGGVCFARNCFTAAFAFSSAAPSFHSVMYSELGRSFAVSSEIGRGWASSLPASTKDGVLQFF